MLLVDDCKPTVLIFTIVVTAENFPLGRYPMIMYISFSVHNLLFLRGSSGAGESTYLQVSSICLADMCIQYIQLQYATKSYRNRGKQITFLFRSHNCLNNFLSIVPNKLKLSTYRALSFTHSIKCSGSSCSAVFISKSEIAFLKQKLNSSARATFLLINPFVPSYECSTIFCNTRHQSKLGHLQAYTLMHKPCFMMKAKLITVYTNIHQMFPSVCAIGSTFHTQTINKIHLYIVYKYYALLQTRFQNYYPQSVQC